MLTLNTIAGVHLEEEDIVRLLEGPRRGALGKVVGFDYENDQVVVQYSRPRVGGIIREGVPVNALEMYKVPERRILDPLPATAAALCEQLQLDRPLGCGAMVSIPLKEGRGAVTFVPRGILPLGPIALRPGLKERVRALFEYGFVTRLPHLVQVGKVRHLGAVLQEISDPASVVDRLLAETEK